MVIELIFILILVVSTLSGYRKGLLMSLCTLLVLVLCGLGASLAQEMFTPKAVEFLEPSVEQMVAQEIRQQVQTDTDQALSEAGDAGDILGDLGAMLGVDLTQTVTDSTETLVEAAAQSVAKAIVEPLAGLLIYLVAFLILYLVLHGAALAINVVDRLPGIHTLNRLGGAVLGFSTGLLVLVLLVGVGQKAGYLAENTTLGPIGSLLEGWLQGEL
jgi:hypothetical protein